MQAAIQKLLKLGTMSNELQVELLNRVKMLDVADGQKLLLPGDFCKHVYFIEKGALVCYRSVKIPGKTTSKKIYSWLMFEGEIVTSVNSFNNNVASVETIRARGKSILWFMHRDDIDFLTLHYPEFAMIRVQLTEWYSSQAWEMESRRKDPPEEFLKYLEEKYKDHLKRIPKTLMASLMGVSKSSLHDKIKKRKE